MLTTMFVDAIDMSHFVCIGVNDLFQNRWTKMLIEFWIVFCSFGSE